MSIIAPDTAGLENVDEPIDANVLDVFDGDGFLADIWIPARAQTLSRVPFRFAFIDAPEMQQPFGPEAKALLQYLIFGRKLRLGLIGKESSGYIPIDSYKRLLCLAFLTEELEQGPVHYFLNGKCELGQSRRARSVVRNVELEMIVNGMAWVTRQYSFEREDEYLAAQSIAQCERRGLWSMNNPEPPWRFKQRARRQREAEERQPGLFAR